MAEPHYLSGDGIRTREAVLPASIGIADDHFFRRYRSLLDAEDAAFDELEHAYEDGDRASYESDLAVWRTAIERRTSFLATLGLGGNTITA